MAGEKQIERLRAEEGEDPEIVLVGVVHGDPEGYDKLRGLFEGLRPRLISVEISEYSWRYRRSRGERWRQQLWQERQLLPERQWNHLALRRVTEQIAYPFEVKAAEDYAREHGAGWLAVDINGLAREHLPRYGMELLSSKNLQHLVSTPDGDWEEYIRQEYRRAHRGWQTGAAGVAVAGEGAQARMREKVLAHRVKRLAKHWRGVVHVGGWEHLVRSGLRKTMADYFGAWRVKRILMEGPRVEEETGDRRRGTGDKGPETGEKQD